MKRPLPPDHRGKRTARGRPPGSRLEQEINRQTRLRKQSVRRHAERRHWKQEDE